MTDIPNQYNNSTTPGFSFSATSEVATAAAGVLVGSSQGVGVDMTSSYFNDSLINNGDILSGDFAAVNCDSNNAHITNNISGAIVGFQGIYAKADYQVIVNHGSVFGFGDGGIFTDVDSNHVSVANDGEVYGRIMGVYSGSNHLGATISNTGSGVIRSDHYGIEVFTNGGSNTVITNAAGATIRGSDYSVFTQGGAMQLSNDGKLFGTVRCDAANASDWVNNHGTITGSVYLGAGNDTYVGQGGGTVTGTIQGGDGTDTFYAGVKREVFYGNAGADKFIFNATVFSPAGASRDFIEDFHHSELDRIDVHAIDADLTHAGNQAFSFIGADSFAHYHSTHASVVGMLRFDAVSHHLQGNVNADFANAEFELALTGVTALHAGDFVL